MNSVNPPGFLKPYTGYVREGFTYATYLIRPKRTPKTKFVIFTVGRTGSNLLVSLLNSHPQIQCHSELLYRRVAFPKFYLKCQEKLSRKDIYGYKLLLYNFGVQKIGDPLRILQGLQNNGYKIISLKRRNILRQTISHMYALYRGNFHLNRKDAKQYTPKMKIDPKDLEQELNFFVDQRYREEQILNHLSYLQLYYEDDLIDENCHQKAMGKITEYLGIATIAATTDLVKTTPQNLANVIDNFDEFKSFVEHTEYYRFLDEI